MARTPEYLILDIETVPDVERWQRPDVPEGAPPGREHREAFPPTWAHRIVVVGWIWLDQSYRLKQIGVLGDAPPSAGTTADDRERALLVELSTAIGRRKPVLVTYNGRSFDLPVIAQRSLCHAVPIGWYYRERGIRYRFSEDGHLDLCDWLADHGATRAGKLDQVARLIGLPGKVGIDGSQVEGLYQAGDLAAIQTYCLADVAQTALLLLRFRLLQAQLSVEAYHDRMAALLDALAADGRVADVLAGIDRARLLGPAPAAEA
ncbi:MAG TPA: ribonuclease H-like domain-containing protein [Kofleriaceae bacterium]|nr:ribonuclease H-like domain-containing protein [Kofleriaceae bacterium]